MSVRHGNGPLLPIKEQLARALEAAGADVRLIERARAGYYDELESPLSLPMRQLEEDLKAAGLDDLAMQARQGDFDGSRAEDAWAARRGSKRTERIPRRRKHPRWR